MSNQNIAEESNQRKEQSTRRRGKSSAPTGEALMCGSSGKSNDGNEAHTEVPQRHRQDARLLLPIQPLAPLDKAVYRFWYVSRLCTYMPSCCSCVLWCSRSLISSPPARICARHC